MMKKKLITALITVCLALGAAFIPEINTFVPISISAEASSVAAPTFSKSAGRYYATFSLKLVAQSGAKIYYTTNGTAPTTASTQYTGAITISKTTTVKAIAVSGGVKSSVISKKYIISSKKPTCNLSSGTYSGAQSVTLKCSTSGAKIYYTLDGTKPTAKSTLYSGAITVDESCTLRAVAIKTGLSKSLYLKRTYIVQIAAEKISDYTQKYGYSALSSTEKKVYELIYKASGDFNTSVDISQYKITPTQLSDIYSAVCDDNPWLFCMYSGFSYSYYDENEVVSVNLKYTLTSSEYSAAYSKLKKRVDSVVDKVNAESALFDKLLIIHDEIVDNCSYSTKGNQVANAYGCLVNGSALCEGYSRAFQLLCHESGIPCILVTGYASESHMWNMVLLDGEWYHFDITWDDPVSSSADNKTYDYFNVTTVQIKTDHTISDNPYPIPTAYGTKYNYYTYIGDEVYTNSTEAIEQLKLLIAQAQETKQTEVSIMCDMNVYNKVVSDFINSKDYIKLFKTLNAASSNTLQYTILYGYRVVKNVKLTITLYY